MDAVEGCLSSLVCQSKVSLEDAQAAIFEDWRKAGKLCEEKWGPRGDPNRALVPSSESSTASRRDAR